MSKTDLSQRAGAFQLSLLASLGLLPSACGGETGSGGTSGPGTSAGVGGSTLATGGATGGSGGSLGNGGNSPAGTGSVPINAPAIGIPPCGAETVDPTTHLAACANRDLHRPAPTECTFHVSAAGADAADAADAANTVDAASAADGSADEGGAGRARSGANGPCLRDSECGPGLVCLCYDPGPQAPVQGHCLLAACRTDQDCGARSRCALTVEQFACLTALDQCTGPFDSNCPQGSKCLVQNGHRTCVGYSGRPFLVAEQLRVAGLIGSADWLGGSSRAPSVRELSPRARVVLAAHWARLGQMEHASIAAFARFNLQLLSVGAPAALVEACNRAMIDETAHARLCFDLASQYGGTPVGPGPIDIGRCLEETSLTEVAKLVLSEGCLGETVAALEALEAADHATDPAVKQTLSRIADDEQRHAELAFQFLRWVLDRSSPAVKEQIARGAAARMQDFERANEPQGEAPDAWDDELSAHGLLPTHTRRAIQKSALRDVVRPLLIGLLGRARVDVLTFSPAAAREDP